MSQVQKKVGEKKPTVGKCFRLFDFHVYDETVEQTPSSDDDGSSDGSTDYKKKFVVREDARFAIQMFGLNERGETCSIFINDYQPFFYIRVGDSWKQQEVALLLQELRKRVGNFHKTAIVSAELVNHHKLYGFSGGKTHQFVKVTFKNTAAFAKTKNLWYEFAKQGERMATGDYKTFRPWEFCGVSLELYESNIPPLLRYFHIQSVSPSGWVFVPTGRVSEPATRSTTCTYEYCCSQKYVKPMPQKETRVPYKICSFDIEASSSHGDFPIPIKTYKRLAANTVDACIRQGVDDAARLALLLKRSILTAFGYDTFDDIDTVYPKQPSSKNLLLHLIELLKKTPVKNAKAMNTEEDNSHILAIDIIFDRIKDYNEGATRAGKSGAAQNGDDAQGQDDDDDDDDDDARPVADMVEGGGPRRGNKTIIKVEKKATIMDILLNDKYQRDEKVQLLNETLTILFPRLEGDTVTFIGSTFMRYGDAEPYLNHCLVHGSCDPVEGATIESVDTECNLLLKWAELIQKEDPDIIIGYNIFGFDYEFMFRRAQENHCENEFLKLSRKTDELCAKKPMSYGKGGGPDPDEDDGELSIASTKIVLASGEYDLKYYNMRGRLQIDMYTYLRRDFNLSSYKLDDVAGQYISDDIKQVVHSVSASSASSAGLVTELHSGNLTGLHIGDYIHIEIGGFTSDYYEHGKKFRILDLKKKTPDAAKPTIIVIEGHEPIGQHKNTKWGMAKDDVTPQDIFRLAKGSATDRAVVAKYCIQDCNLVHHLMNKIDVLTGYIEMSRICSVPISFLVFRGQGIKLTSYVAKKCREKNTLMPDLEKTAEGEGYEGALVLPPKCSMYMDNPIACVDYSSLYPSSMISQNYSHDSKVWTQEFDLSGRLIKETGEKDVKTGLFIYDNLPGYKYIDIEFDTYKYLRNQARPAAKATKTKVGKMVCRWAQLPKDEKSIMPSILVELLEARKSTRKMIKSESDPFMQNILDKRQLGYKVTANSLYGQCGARTSTFYEKDVAACTTATGRQMITYARRMIEEVYGDLVYDTEDEGHVRCRAEYIYGDTDSVFFTFNLEDPVTKEKIRGQRALKITIEIAQDAAKLCSQFLKPPMDLAYEKTLMPFILLSKKRYVGILYEDDPNKGKMKYMGLSLKRRDSCDYLKDVYGGILNILMKPVPGHENSNSGIIQRAVDFLNVSIQQLVDGVVPIHKLMLTKALRGYYKNPQQIAHSVLAERIGKRDPGNKPKPGDRMQFAFIVNPNKRALQGEKIETPEFIQEQGLVLDYSYYITNQLMKPLQQLFGLAVELIWENQGKGSAVKTYRRELVDLQREFPDIETFMKKKEKLSSAKVKLLLFEKFLTKIRNQQAGLQSIAGFFAPKQPV